MKKKKILACCLALPGLAWAGLQPCPEEKVIPCVYDVQQGMPAGAFLQRQRERLHEGIAAARLKMLREQVADDGDHISAHELEDWLAPLHEAADGIMVAMSRAYRSQLAFAEAATMPNERFGAEGNARLARLREACRIRLQVEFDRAVSQFLARCSWAGSPAAKDDLPLPVFVDALMRRNERCVCNAEVQGYALEAAACMRRQLAQERESLSAAMKASDVVGVLRPATGDEAAKAFAEAEAAWDAWVAAMLRARALPRPEGTGDPKSEAELEIQLLLGHERSLAELALPRS